MRVIGTAGHVDHGKSALVKAMTGIDPDRLDEEKSRGLTIDIGFAWMVLPSGTLIGIVDVPGHERFIKNMLAGTGAISATIFVVAADDGWKPQSQEHLDIIDILGIQSAVVALTKVDLIPDAKRVVVRDEIRTHLKGSSLESVQIVDVSSVTREGIDELVARIDEILASAELPKDSGRPRLWIDRSFSMKGSGTVVTGTLVGGNLETGSNVEILPQGLVARIRGLQTHGQSLTVAQPGTRVAVNLAAIQTQEVERGSVLAMQGTWRSTNDLIASIKFLPQLPHKPTVRGAFKLYIGSAEVDATFKFLGEAPELGTEGSAWIKLKDPIVSDIGDRFVLRDSSRRETIAGGVVLEPHPKQMSSVRALAAADLRRSANSRSEYLHVLLEEHRYLDDAEVATRVGRFELEDGHAMHIGRWWFSPKYLDKAESNINNAIRGHHEKQPLDSGISKEALSAVAGVPIPILGVVLEQMIQRGEVETSGATFNAPGFAPKIENEEATRLVKVLDEAGASPPLVSELSERFGIDLIKALVRSGHLVQVSHGIVYSRSSYEQVLDKVRRLVEETGPFTVAQFRDSISTTRKYAVPLLEHLDQSMFTLRKGDTRILGPTATNAI